MAVSGTRNVRVMYLDDKQKTCFKFPQLRSEVSLYHANLRKVRWQTGLPSKNTAMKSHKPPVPSAKMPQNWGIWGHSTLGIQSHLSNMSCVSKISNKFCKHGGAVSPLLHMHLSLLCVRAFNSSGHSFKYPRKHATPWKTPAEHRSHSPGIGRKRPSPPSGKVNRSCPRSQCRMLSSSNASASSGSSSFSSWRKNDPWSFEIWYAHVERKWNVLKKNAPAQNPNSMRQHRTLQYIIVSHA